MAKSKTVFFCKECGNESSKWLGQCPACKQWDTMVEQKLEKNIYKTNLGGKLMFSLELDEGSQNSVVIDKL